MRVPIAHIGRDFAHECEGNHASTSFSSGATTCRVYSHCTRTCFCTFLEFFLLSRLYQVWVAMRAYCTRETDSRPLALFQSVDADKDGIVVRFEMLPSFV
jgi:hypothetical protein